MNTLSAIGLLAFAAITVGVLWSIRPGGAIRAARRSVRLSFPLALGVALAPIPALKPCPWACPPIVTSGPTTRFHDDCFHQRTDDHILECLHEVDRMIERLRLMGQIK